MKCQVHFFRECGGKWYAEEVVELPDGIMPWDARAIIADQVPRYQGMTAVLIEAPWGYPQIFYRHREIL